MDLSAAVPNSVRHAPPELLAPAGDRECLQAAIENGADAVYFGLNSGFNARARAANFAISELPQVMALLRRRGVRGYVTLNTLAFPGELTECEQTIRLLAEAGVDALLVQDLGLAKLARAICPDLPLHASTQMTLTSAECITVAQSLGIERVVLARELSLREIMAIAKQTTLPLEVFVHGALCVAYSGQCMTSEALGGRSANRGQCAQACRLPYEVVCDGQDVDLGSVQYLLSPQDLAAYALVPDLLAAGVCALKIEGRLKTPEYVANITRHYRRAIDAAVAGQPAEFTLRDVEEMELSFSRGFSPGWLEGNNHKRLVPGLSSAKRGILVGKVRGVRGERVRVELQTSLRRGDGLAFGGGVGDSSPQGGRVFEIFCGGESRLDAQSGIVDLAFAHGAIDLTRLQPGHEVWKTDDPQLTRRLRQSFAEGHVGKTVAVELEVEAQVGSPLVIRARLTSGQACRLESAEPLSEAIRHEITEEVLRQQFSRLGGTGYTLGSLVAQITGRPMVPLSVLGSLRHELVRQLDAASVTPPPRRIAPHSSLDELTAAIWSGESAPHSAASGMDTSPTIHVLCRSLAQLREVLEQGARSVLVDFPDIRGYGEATQAAHAVGAAILLATPRIHKPDETGLLRVLLRPAADGILARNLAAVAFCAREGVPFVADFSLNAANPLTVDFLRRQGAQRITASYDLDRDQLLDLVAGVPPQWMEVVIHQHMPMFHMEHCVFCAVLSPGTDKTNCGRPCDEHAVRLRDRIGMEHPLHADVGCRNTLYNAVPQSAAEVVSALLARGVRHFRLELMPELSTADLGRTLELYRGLVEGRYLGKQVWTELKAVSQVGVTRGTLDQHRSPLTILH